MWRVKVRQIGKGLHPSEVVVEVQTTEGAERLVIDKRSLQANSLPVGSPVGRKKGQWLVELPHETMNGLWRVWVKNNTVIADSERAGAM